MKKRIVLILATGFGLGLSPFASGTVGTLLGIGIAFAMVPMADLPFGIIWQALLCLVLVLTAIPICGRAEAYFGKKDDGRIVADEYLTFPLVLLGIPWTENYGYLAMAFLTHRVLDIIKPPPAYQVQKIGGGTGIVLDDVISSLYALGLNHLIVWTIARCFSGQ